MLHGVSLEVAAGEVFGFVGPNGAGKTTFLKSLLGIVRPDAGSITIADIDARRRPLRARRNVGYAPGETAMYDSFRVLTMLEFALAFHESASLERGRALLSRFGLPEKRRVRQLSHGMKRKLLLAQAIASGAPVLMLDEPMEGLDPEARRDVEVLLAQEAAAGRTVFFSSHDLPSVERVCRRVAFLRGGRLLECGPVEEILSRASHTLLVQLREPREPDALPSGPGLEWTGEGKRWRLAYRGNAEDALAQLTALPIASLRDASGGLEEVFEALYGAEEDAS